MLLVVLCITNNVYAASPLLRNITPRGGQRGSTVDLVFHGRHFSDAVTILFHSPGFTCEKIEVMNDKNLKATIAIAPDAALGEHRMRVHCSSGVSEVHTFWVGPFPGVKEKEPNSEFDTPQPIDMNVTVHGNIGNEDVDYFIVNATKGQRVSAEIEGMRLGGNFFDPYIAILDHRRYELASCDDSALLLQDGHASIVAPADGQYVVMVRDASYEGGGGCDYRLHVGAFPRPSAVYPAGGPKGRELSVRFIGMGDKQAERTLTLPDDGDEYLPVFAELDGVSSPSRNVIRVSEFDNALEAEPNDKRAEATAYEGKLPVALNGIIEKPGDEDWFKVSARKDEYFHIHVFARRLRSPLDAVLSLHDGNGKRIAGEDDKVGPDPLISYKFPEDGDYYLRIADHLGDGGEDYVYRVEFLRNEPEIDLTFPYAKPYDTQTRQTIVVPAGGRYAALVNVMRDNFNGDVIFDAPDLPPGITMHAEPVPRSISAMPVVFEAAADAPREARVITFGARGTEDNNKHIRGHLTQSVHMIRAKGNAVFYKTLADKVAAAVVDPAPFAIDIVPPKAPLVRDGSMNLKIKLTRNEKFNNPVTVRMLWKPPGIGAQSQISIPGDASEADYPISANDKAELATWKIAVLAEANEGGTHYVASSLTPLTVAEPFVTAKIDLAAIEQGKGGDLLVNLEQHHAFDGEASIKIIGLPHDVKTEDKTFTKDDTQLIFPLTSTDKSPVGQHKSVFCQVTLMQHGEPVLHNLAKGGVLRIDRPPPPPPEGEKPKPKPKPQPKAEKKQPEAKPLSRLEKLRLEAEQRARQEASP